ncbi:hypothetical protein MMC21_007854 [Puttea exsequens]|nr:hypothetical protein [Puttea exsequens]
MSAPIGPAHPMAHPYGGDGPTIMAVSWVQAALAVFLMGLRTYTNARIVKSFRWDYWWALLTLVVGMVCQVMLTVSCVWGMGNHIELLTPEQTKKALQWSWIGQIILIQTIGTGKIAVVAFLLRIQSGANTKKNRYLTWLLYFIAFSNIIVNIDQAILILTACSPVGKLWDPLLPGSCSNIVRTNHVGYFQGGWAALSDIVLALYPVLVFWNLQITNKIKIGLCALMAGGLVAAAAGITKTVYLKLIAAEQDITYAESPLLIWGWTENWLVLILGCLPPLNAFFLRVFQRVLSSSNGRRSTKPGAGGYYQQQYSSDRINGSHTRGAGSKHRSGIPLNNFSSPFYSTKNSNNNNAVNDDDSEKNILPGVMPGSKDIMRTTHVHVAHEDKGESPDGVGGREDTFFNDSHV